MNKQDKHLETLSEIRSLMERSSRFLSLSGLSGIVAGCFALLGVAIAYLYLGIMPLDSYTPYLENPAPIKWGLSYWKFISLDAGCVLVASIIAIGILTRRKAKKAGQPSWNHTAKRTLLNLLLPLITGGLFCLILLYHSRTYPNLLAFLSSTTLIFYGLALINASKYTLIEIRYLGVSEVFLGLVSAFFIGYGLLFWAIGFGILHIAYGTMMYLKYDR